MNRLNDISKALTAEDVIRRYNLDELKTDRQAIKVLTRSVENQYTIVKQFIQNVALYTDQADSTVWFFNGVPTLLNDPYKSFDDPSEHVNDLYYDRETGNVYQLKYDTTYHWDLITDSALSQSLAIANSEADSQDNKRRVFYNQPVPPYDTGDIWINDDLIMRCRCSRDGDSFKESEWVSQNNYSESCVLLDVRAVLDAFIENVENNYVTTSRLETTKNTIEAEVTSKLDGVDDADGNVTAASVVLAVNGSDSSVTINGNKINLSANDILNLLAGNTINLTSKNITIASDHFSVAANGDVVATNGTFSGTLKGSKFKGTSNNSVFAKIGTDSSGWLSTDNCFEVLYENDGSRILGIYGKFWNTNLKATYLDTSGNAFVLTKKLIAPNIDAGTCNLSTNADSTVYFNKTFANTPKVVLTNNTNGTATQYNPAVINVTTTYFVAYMQAPGTVTNQPFTWIAIDA